MLTITSEAAEVIHAIVASSPIPDGGVKISAKPINDSESRLELSIVEGPTETDSVVEESGTKLFLEDGVTGYLDDKVLDAQMEEGEVRFTIQEQRGPETV